MSAENLSEDSGYSDHFCNINKPIINMQVQGIIIPKKSTQKLNNELKYPKAYNKVTNLRTRSFQTYDGEPYFHNVASCFGSSYQDLTVFDKYENGLALGKRAMPRTTDVLNIVLECNAASKYNPVDVVSASCSEPDLLQRDTTSEHRRCLDTNRVSCKQGFFGESVCVASVPKDLNLFGDNSAFVSYTNSESIAAKNWDLCTLTTDQVDNMAAHTNDIISDHISKYKREDSYIQAVSDYLDDEQQSNDDESQITKAVSDNSIQSFNDMFYHSTPINKKIVTSTPNLTTVEKIDIIEDPTYMHSSMLNVPRKSSLVTDKSEMKKASSATSSNKGVHFCPVVSEVSWAETSFSSSEEESSEEEESDASSDLSDELKECDEITKNTEKNKEIEYLFVPPTLNEINKLNTEAEANVYVPPPTVDHVTAPAGAQTNETIQFKRDRAATNMEPPDIQKSENTRKSGTKFTNFLSRFASFRFSNRNRNRNKKEQDKNNINSLNHAPKTQQRVATKDDYIYIPLKVPHADGETQPVEKLSKKPPLPGGCARRAVIDRVRGVARAPARRECMDGIAPCRPGLIETDLDTQVTKVVAGHVSEKTRSLMNLGGPGTDQAGQLPPPLAVPLNAHRARPHKSMEFLLDKDNIRSVQVSHAPSVHPVHPVTVTEYYANSRHFTCSLKFVLFGCPYNVFYT